MFRMQSPITIPAPEPLLAFNARFNRWECETDAVFAWMSDETFQSYCEGWLQCQGIPGKPTAAQYVEAAKHCRKLSYFDKCVDRNVHRCPSSKGWK